MYSNNPIIQLFINLINLMFTTEEIIKSTCAILKGKPGKISGVSTDTRTINPGDLFVALHGKNFDGNDFVEQAELKGASAVMVQSECSNNIAQFIVKNTNKSFLDLSSFYRSKFDFPVIGVTGSFGKTTVKEMVAAILDKIGNPVCNLKNFNNEIGVPTTLLNFNEFHSHAVIEMGMNHSGEINVLSNCVKPDVAVITGIGSAHIEFFDSIRDIADAKLEILNGLKKGGTVVLPKDDPLYNYLKEKTEDAGDFNIVTFGSLNNPDYKFICKKETIKGVEGKIVSKDFEINIGVNMIGIHNGLNAVAAVAAVISVNSKIKTELIKKALEEMKEIEMRCEIKNFKGINFILDCYNANLDSGIAALTALSKIETGGKKVAFLGDMMEQGTKSDENHYELGKKVALTGVDILVAVGKNSLKIKAGALDNYMNSENVFAFADKTSAAVFLKKNLNADDIVLVKASRIMRLEDAVKMIYEPDKLMAA